MNDLISWWPILAVLLVVALFGVLGIHYLNKAIRGMRSGVVEGLVLGHFGKKYSRKDDSSAFWLNVCVGFIVATLGLIVILWAILWVSMLIAAYQGYPTL